MEDEDGINSPRNYCKKAGRIERRTNWKHLWREKRRKFEDKFE